MSNLQNERDSVIIQAALGHARCKEKTVNTLTKIVCATMRESRSRRPCISWAFSKRTVRKDTLILPLRGFRAISLRRRDDILQNNRYNVALETDTEELTAENFEQAR